MSVRTKKISTAIFMLIFILAICAYIGFLYLSPYVDRSITINDHRIFVQDRTTTEQLQKGLSERKGLCSRCGMLFLFPSKSEHGFWMKDMKFDIDILWLDDGKVVHIERNVSHQTPEVIYRPQELVNAVLELPAGKSDALNIQEGTMISL